MRWRGRLRARPGLGAVQPRVLVQPYPDARPTDLAELRALLLDGALAREVRDRAWRQVIRQTRDYEEWMVAA
ncbi:hypothetical protein [Nocardiopsis nanhaiensis]